MKICRGAWLLEPGVHPTPVRRVYTHRQSGDTLALTTLDRNGGKFEGVCLHVRMSSPLSDVIRVEVEHHHAPTRGHSCFDLDYSLAASNVVIEERPDALRFASGNLALVIGRSGDWSMRFESAGEPIAAGGSGSVSSVAVDGRGPFMVQRLSLRGDECIYGLGERFGPLVRNGQQVVVWNEDSGTNSEWAYKNIPFYLSSAGYGLLVNSPGRVEFEIGTERVSEVQFAVPGERLDYYFILGPDPKSVFEKYTRLAGRPPVPPPWSFGLWLSTSFTTQYDEQTVSQFVDGMADRNIPLQVFHFDCFWMRERHWCDFEWDPKAFPDPGGMLRRLKARGLKICLWINPYISGLSPLFAEGAANGYFIRRIDGSVYQRDQWQPSMAIVDFTNPAAVRWFQGKLRPLLELGADCFKTDFGERIPDEGVTYHDGSDPKLMHNLYAYLYNQAVFELLEDFHGKGNAVVFARAATGGSQKFPVHWGGDCAATFEAMAEDLRGGLSFCLSGPAFWSHDIGGFAGKPDPALYKRWVAFGLLSTHSRLHGSESYRVPWLFDEESVDVLRLFTRLRNRLFPYLYSVAHDAAHFGHPMMRAMVLEFPDDPTCRHLDRQYMLGPSLLVAPVFRGDGQVEYYLPDGTWTHLLSGETRQGGRWVRERVGFLSVPAWVRANALLPMSEHEDRPAWRLGDPLDLHVYALADGASTTIRLVSDDGQPTVIRCRRREAEIRFEGDGGASQLRVTLHGQAAAFPACNATRVSTDHEPPRFHWIDTTRPMGLTLSS